MNRTPAVQRFARRVLVAAGLLAGITVVLLLLWSLAEVWLVMFSGLLFAVFLRALTRPLVTRLHLAHGLAYAAVLLFVILAMVAMLVVFVPLFSQGMSALTEGLPENLARIAEQMERYQWGRDLLDQMGDVDWASYTAGTLSRLAGFFSTAIGVISVSVLILITGLYLAADPDVYVNGTIRLFPPKNRARAAQILKTLQDAMEWWLVGRIASMALIGVLTWFALLLLQIPFAATLAFLAGLLSFIPNVGPILSAVPAVLIGAGISPAQGLYVVVVYIVVQIIESYFVTPIIQRHTIDLPPATALIMQIAFTALYGFLGLLLAVPLTVVLMVLVKIIYLEGILGESTESPGR